MQGSFFCVYIPLLVILVFWIFWLLLGALMVQECSRLSFFCAMTVFRF